MKSQTAVSRSDVEHAEALIRALLVSGFDTRAEADAKSLTRMLVHLVRIQVAISGSPDDHANAAKRLQDFSIAAWRMASRNPEFAAELTRIMHALHTASVRLKKSIGIDEAALAPA